jgi:sulfur carrier protein ThiS
MNVWIEFMGFPAIYHLFPEGLHPYRFEGTTLMDLVRDLADRRPPEVRESLLEGSTQSLDPTIQITINGRFVSKDEILRKKIHEGDRVAFLRLLAGG